MKKYKEVTNIRSARDSLATLWNVWIFVLSKTIDD